MRKLKRLGYVIFTNDLHPLGLAHGTVCFNCFVHHVPTLDPSFVTTHNRVDVVSQTIQKHLAACEFSISILKNPIGSLPVPDQRMPNDVHAVLFTKLDISIT